MKKYIIALTLFAVSSFGAELADILATNVFTCPVMVQTNFLAEMDFVDEAIQEFTGGEYGIITNLQCNICDANFTTTDSNVTVTAAGRYTAYMNLSFNSDTGAAEVECYLFTNGTKALTASGQGIGWDRSVSAQNADGTIATTKTLTLPAGCVVDWRVEPVATETLQWDHGTIGLERK